MGITGFDHIVLCVADVAATVRFYRDLLGLRAAEERPGKWALYFGDHKISLQDPQTLPAIARNTVPGSGNFCLLSTTPVAEHARVLRQAGVEIEVEPSPREGARGPILSIYFRDPDGNLVEIASPQG